MPIVTGNMFNSGIHETRLTKFDNIQVPNMIFQYIVPTIFAVVNTIIRPKNIAPIPPKNNKMSPRNSAPAKVNIRPPMVKPPDSRIPIRLRFVTNSMP